jgi:hypothetical protein
MPQSKRRFFGFFILVFTFSNCGYKISESSFGGGQFSVPQNKKSQLKFNLVNELDILETAPQSPIINHSNTPYCIESIPYTKKYFHCDAKSKSLKTFVNNFNKQKPYTSKSPSKSSDTKPEGPMNLWQTVETLLGFVIGMAALVLGTNFFMSMLTVWSGIVAYKMNTSIKNLRYYKKESGLKTLSIITIIIGAITIALNLPQLSLLRILGIAGITLLIALALLGITKYLIFKFVK